ncbi:MAG: protein kinase domain-containing protein [Kiritimatiellia bacterium]
MHVPEIQGIEIEEKVGEGGMATVWRGRQLTLDRPVAVKVLQAQWGDDPADVERFKAEARAAARLKHASIIQVHDANFVEGRYYIVMEFIDGYTVGDWLRRKGKLTQKDALLIAECVADGLVYAWHNARMIHCDIKPDNVMVDRDGTVKIADLGLARTIDVLRPGSETEEEVMGTPAYMSPEQVRGVSDLDCRADIYALGCMLYHILTGTIPFEGMDVDAVLAKQTSGHLPDVMDVVDGVSKPMCALLQKMMAKDRDLRQADWQEVLQDIRRVRHGHLPSRLPPPDASTMSCSKRRMGAGRDSHAGKGAGQHASKESRNLVPIFLALGVCLAGVLGYIWLQPAKSPPLVVLPSVDEGVPTASDGDAQAQAQYQAALARFEQDPMDFDGAIRALRAVVSAHTDTEYASLARADMQRIAILKQNEIDRMMALLRQQAQEREAHGDFDGAQALLLGYDGALAAATAALRREEVSALQQRHEAHTLAIREAEVLRQQRISAAWQYLCRVLLDDGVAAALSSVAMVLERDFLQDDSREHFVAINGLLSQAASLNWRVLQSFEQEKEREIGVHLGTGPQNLVILAVDYDAETVMAEQRFMVRGHHAARGVRFSIHDLAAAEYARRAGGEGDLALQLVGILDTWSSIELADLESQLAVFPAPFSEVLFAQMRARRGADRESSARDFLLEGLQRIGLAIDRAGTYADWGHALGVASRSGTLQADAVALASAFEAAFADTQVARDAAGVLHALRSSAVRAAEPEAIGQEGGGAPLQARERRSRGLVVDADAHIERDDQLRRAMVEQNPELFAMDVRIFRDSGSGEAKKVEVVSGVLSSIGPFASVASLEEIVCAGVDPKHTWRNRPIAPLRDLSPLRGLSLETLCINNTSVRDLSPLLGMPLLSFNASYSQVTDISPLRHAPLEVVLLRGTSVRDLSVLRGKALSRVDVSNTAVFDFRPLASRALIHLEASGTQLRDLSIVQGSPLQRLNISGSGVFDFSPLRDLPLEHLEMDKTQIKDLSFLRGKSLRYLAIRETGVTDISVLSGMPLRNLYLGKTSVSDFSVLASLPLRDLDLSHTRIVDLTVLAGLPLETLHLANTRVRDLRPLEGMPIRTLDISRVPVESLMPLASMPIQRLTIHNPERAEVRRVLRRMPQLRFVNGQEWLP